MYSKSRADFSRTVTFRLTLWYTAVFGGLSLAVFLIVYISLTSHLREQMDNELRDTAKEFAALYESHGTQALQAEFKREAESRGLKRVFFRLLSSEGKVLAASDLSQWDWLEELRPRNTVSAGKQLFFSTLLPPGYQHKVRMVTKSALDGNTLEIGLTLQGNEIMMERYRETFGIALMIMIILGSFVGWLLARKAMSGVRRVAHTASQIGKGDLARRVPPGNEGQEINALAHAFNEMLGRIESLVRELKQVTDNVAHELRTPITRIRGIAETTLNGPGDLSEYREMAAMVIEGSDRLIEMINTMLEITRTGSGVAELASESLDIRKIAEEAADLFKPLAEDKEINVQLNIPPRTVIVQGDRSRLQRVVANLLDNAIRYTPSGGTVAISVEADMATVQVKIADTGMGVDKKDLGYIFDRFYRGDKSRSTPGSGLGLSLALAIIRAHGGDITVKSTHGAGTAFTIILPRISASQ